jgi:4-carboxymuconolactone decarboxylase
MANKTLKQSFEAGMKTRRKVLGDAWVDKSIATQTDFNAEFLDLITRHAWDDVWNRPGLPRKTRRMIVIAQTAAMGRWEEFTLHTRAALEHKDLSENDLKEILIQTAAYCGIPTANTAFKEARAVIAELAARKKKAPAAR